MSKLKSVIGLTLSLLIAVPPGALASSHREAPITALDHTADITDFYAFVSYDHPDRVTFIVNVDDPAAVGVPEIFPVVVVSVNPAGKVQIPIRALRLPPVRAAIPIPRSRYSAAPDAEHRPGNS